MFTVPEGFNMALLISDLITYIGIPMVSVSVGLGAYRVFKSAIEIIVK